MKTKIATSALRPYLVRVTGIVWDTDGEDVSNLPLPIDTEIVIEATSKEDAEERCTDALSDFYGYCIDSLKCTATDCMPC